MSEQQNHDSDKDEAPLRPYEADGIQELDNNLPSWWVGLFAFCVIFSGLYLLYVHGLGGPTIEAEYNASVANSQTTSSGASTATSPSDMKEMLGSSASVAAGRETFQSTCAACHGQNGEGTIGPNLADKFWLHGNKPEQIQMSIAVGYPDKGMPGWGTILGDKKVIQLTAFVISLKGTNPANGKAPQGAAEE